MNLRAILLCGALSAATLPAADTLTEEFQRALFEEEANRNLPAAIAGYEAVIKRLDEQRQLAATAVFRMGESYRKLGKTNEAVSAYERIITEFADQETLVKLSGQNLSILKPEQPNMSTAIDAPPTALDEETIGRHLELFDNEIGLLQAEINRLAGVSNMQAELIATQRQLLQVQRDRATLAGRLRQTGNTNPPSTMTAEEAEELRRVQGLVANSPDLINAPGQDSVPPLHQAIKNGHVQVFRYLLDHGADVNNQRGASASPMHAAASSGQLVIMDELLARSANPSLRDNEGNTPLHRAAQLGFVAVAEKLLKAGVDINALSSARASVDERSPLQLAIAFNQAAMVQLLITNGANVSLQSGQLNPPLFLAFKRGQQFIDTLFAAGADPNGTNTSGGSLLYLATEQAGNAVRYRGQAHSLPQDVHPKVLDTDWTAITRQLLDKGANVNVGLAPSAQVPQGVTPLFPAVDSGDVELVALLLKRGADPKLSLGFGRAVRGGGRGWLQPVLQHAVAPGWLPLVELLLKHGADPNARSQTADNALMKALEWRQVDITAALLKAGADPNLTNSAGQSALALACERLSQFPDPALSANQTIRQPSAGVVRGFDNVPSDPRQTPQEQVEDWLAMIRLLLANGAKLDVPMSTDDTTRPLHRAAISRVDLVKLLLDAKASVAATNRFGHTPLFAAAGANRPEAVRLLVAAGAKVNASDIKGNTPLHLAIMRDSLEAAQVLLELGADKSAANKDGQAPERIAISFPAPGMPTVFDGALPDYDRSAVTGPSPVNMNSKRRVADLFKSE